MVNNSGDTIFLNCVVKFAVYTPVIPRSMRILWEFYFDFLCSSGNKFLRFEMTEISVGN